MGLKGPSSGPKSSSVRNLLLCMATLNDLTSIFSSVDVLDGAMVCIATYTLNFLHPGYLLAEVIQEQNEQKHSAKKIKRGGHGMRGSNVRESLVPLKDDDNWVDAEERSPFETEKFIQHV